MKVSTMFLIMTAIQFSIVLVGHSVAVLDSSTLTNSSLSEIPGSSTLSHLSLFESILNPTQWEGGIVFLIIVAVVALVAAGGSVVGQWLGLKSDLITFAPVVSIFLVWCIPIVSLWRVLSEGFAGISGNTVALTSAGALEPASILAGICVAPLVVLCFVTLMNWWRSPLAEG